MNKIGWCDRTWNPITGCTPVSRECDNCWAAKMSKRLAGRYGYPAAPHQFDVTIHPERLYEPVSWRKPQRVFVCSMGDLFHNLVSDEFIFNALSVMEEDAPRHTYMILTKRPERMVDYLRGYNLFTNINLGVTAGYQETADERIPLLLQTPAAVRFVSIEPMLGPVDLGGWLPTGGLDDDARDYYRLPPTLDQVILGCETGPGRRHMRIEDALDVAAQTATAGVALYVKQIEIDGRVSHNPAEWPVELRRREFPA